MSGVLGKSVFRAAFDHGWELRFSLKQMQEVIFELERHMLYKSMTSYADHRAWQDVYHAESRGRDIYIKVTYCPQGGPPVISFKEKDS